ncbi:hypothetical protein L873DRAFT_118633 [Choiromyces venosus 120613-1]|uniref:Uncharacterized protein n=1 Tax=Choiromyces venosus 120613-1 TaxID=1336337 RepID=A0A3N4J490_9PEZI|nr:hypothetical protein L873DRAFT_118633 [Choiromyces venosus 120613-1]
MNTPPRLRSRGRPKTPPTPRHGPMFSSPGPERTSKRKGASSTASYSTATLSPPPSSPIAPRSPEQARTVKGKKRATFAVEEPAEASSSEVDSGGDQEGKAGRGKEDDEIEKILGKSRKTLLNPGGFGLPTPAKTPSRKRKHLDLGEIVGSARVLFPSSSKSKASSSSLSCTRRTLFKKSPPRHRKGGMGSLDLLGDERPTPESISIFTDSNARIPKHDDDPDNPFITRPEEESVTSKRQRIKKRKAESLVADEDREDGMVYVFRGKKIFKKFSEMEDPNERLPSDLDDGEDDEISLERSAIKPRLLFPPRSPKEPEIPVEEEAETDIEESTSSQPATSFTEALATKNKQKELFEKRDISRLTPDSDDDSGRSSVFNLGDKAASKRKSIFDAGEDGDEPVTAPAKKNLRRKRGLEDESATLESPRRVRGKRARV